MNKLLREMFFIFKKLNQKIDYIPNHLVFLRIVGKGKKTEMAALPCAMLNIVECNFMHAFLTEFEWVKTDKDSNSKRGYSI